MKTAILRKPFPVHAIKSRKGPFGNAVAYVEGAEKQQSLARCIQPFMASLPQDVQDVLTAIDIEGKSQKAYAEELGIKYSTLKARVQRGRAQLREIFEACCNFSRDRRGNIVDVIPKNKNCSC